LPRDLGDVLDYFLPADDPGNGKADQKVNVTPAVVRSSKGSGTPSPSYAPFERADHFSTPQSTIRPAALAIVAMPIGERDVIRAAYAWNLAVEVARTGATAVLIAPAESDSSLLWPDAGTGPVGCEMILSDAVNLAELNRVALDIAVARAAESNSGGVVFVRVPPDWLVDAAAARGLLRWILLFGTTEHHDQLEAFNLAKQLLEAHPDTRVGITIHGATRVAEAEQAFHRVAEVAVRHLGHSLRSYGLLVDDLHVYRAIVARRPIGLEHPQSRAALALRDVARLLMEDARELTLA